MRIAITGSSNCGKTTLARGLGTAWGVPVVAEFLGEPYPARSDLTQEQEMDRFEAIFEAKAAREDELSGGFVTDRSSVDLAYAWLIRGLPLNFPDRSRAFLARCRKRAQAYDAVVVPPGPSPDVGAQNYFGKPERIWEMWRNHNAIIGLALRWLPKGRLLLMPDHLQSAQARVEWALEACNPRDRDAR